MLFCLPAGEKGKWWVYLGARLSAGGGILPLIPAAGQKQLRGGLISTTSD